MNFFEGKKSKVKKKKMVLIIVAHTGAELSIVTPITPTSLSTQLFETDVATVFFVEQLASKTVAIKLLDPNDVIQDVTLSHDAQRKYKCFYVLVTTPETAHLLPSSHFVSRNKAERNVVAVKNVLRTFVLDWIIEPTLLQLQTSNHSVMTSFCDTEPLIAPPTDWCYFTSQKQLLLEARMEGMDVTLLLSFVLECHEASSSALAKLVDDSKLNREDSLPPFTAIVAAAPPDLDLSILLAGRGGGTSQDEETHFDPLGAMHSEVQQQKYKQHVRVQLAAMTAAYYLALLPPSTEKSIDSNGLVWEGANIWNTSEMMSPGNSPGLDEFTRLCKMNEI